VRPDRFRATGSRSPHSCLSSTSLCFLAWPTADHDRADLRVVHPNIYPNNWVLVRPTQSRSVPRPSVDTPATRTDWDRERRVGMKRETPPTSLINAEVAGSIPASPTILSRAVRLDAMALIPGRRQRDCQGKASRIPTLVVSRRRRRYSVAFR
jgi:hypothetical protein